MKQHDEIEEEEIFLVKVWDIGVIELGAFEYEWVNKEQIKWHDKIIAKGTPRMKPQVLDKLCSEDFR